MPINFFVFIFLGFSSAARKEASMITSKKIIRMTRTWQKIAAIGRKRIALARTNKKMSAANHSNKSSVVDKGCFAIYTMDKRRFVIPLAFLSNSIFRELFRMSEEEFGLPSDGPITLPCDSVVTNYIISLVKRGLAKDFWIERCSIPLLPIAAYHQILISMTDMQINSQLFVDSE